MTVSFKKSEKFNLYDICFVLSAMAMVAILLALPYEKTKMISLGTYVIAGCSGLMIAKYLLKYKLETATQGVLLLVLAAVCAMAIVLSPSNIRQSLIKAVCFLEIPVFMLCGKELSSKRAAESFLWCQYLLSFYYLYLSFSDKAYLYEGPYEVIEREELTLSYHNPNEAAIYLTCCFLTMMIGMAFYKKIGLKFLFGASGAWTLYLVNLTRSRAGIIASLIAIVFFVFHKRVKIKKDSTRIALAMPFVMAILIYFFNEKLVEFKVLGESAETGRKAVFDQVFEVLDFSEIFTGDFGVFAFDNLHNVYVSVFATIGILGLFFYILYFANVLDSVAEKKLSKIYNKFAYIGVVVLLSYSSVEATIFTGGSAFAMCFMSIFVFCTFDLQQTEDADKEISYVKGRKG